MDEEMSRRGIFGKLLANGLNEIGDFFSGASPARTLTPDQAGILLRSRKTGKKGIHPSATSFETTDTDSGQTGN